MYLGAQSYFAGFHVRRYALTMKRRLTHHVGRVTAPSVLIKRNRDRRGRMCRDRGA